VCHNGTQIYKLLFFSLAFVNHRTAGLARRNQIETMETNQLLALAIAAPAGDKLDWYLGCTAREFEQNREREREALYCRDCTNQTQLVCPLITKCAIKIEATTMQLISVYNRVKVILLHSNG
jgi:hypothetical protein